MKSTQNLYGSKVEMGEADMHRHTYRKMAYETDTYEHTCRISDIQAYTYSHTHTHMHTA
jgi:hypothetical protein